MSELSFSRVIRPHFSIRLLLSDLMLLFSFIISHPLYFFYLVFFSPYIFKLLSFLSPLFITTFLLLLALVTVSPTLFLPPESSDSKLGSLLEKCGSALDKFRPPVVDGGPFEDFRCLEELEAYKIVFEADSFEARGGELQPLEMESEEKHCLPAFEGGTSVVKTDDQNIAEEKRVLMMEEEEKKVECGNISEKVREKKVKAVGAVYDKVDGQKERVTTGGGGGGGGGESEGMGRKIGETPLRPASANGGDGTSKAADVTQRLTASVEREGDSCYDYHNYSSPKKEMETSSHDLGSFGSMRKEKEWKRTLACKLFEERHNVDGSEGMDLLWETYEADSCQVVKAKNDGKKKSSTTKKKDQEAAGAGFAGYYSPEEEEEEEEEGMDRQLCCLQALKFSAGKMGRPNLQKISKALKGIGWLHQVSKHGRKAHR